MHIIILHFLCCAFTCHITPVLVIILFQAVIVCNSFMLNAEAVLFKLSVTFSSLVWAALSACPLRD